MSYSLIVQLLNILQSPEVYVGLESTYNSADSFNDERTLALKFP